MPKILVPKVAKDAVKDSIVMERIYLPPIPKMFITYSKLA